MFVWYLDQQETLFSKGKVTFNIRHDDCVLEHLRQPQ